MTKKEQQFKKRCITEFKLKKEFQTQMQKRVIAEETTWKEIYIQQCLLKRQCIVWKIQGLENCKNGINVYKHDYEYYCKQVKDIENKLIKLGVDENIFSLIEQDSKESLWG